MILIYIVYCYLNFQYQYQCIPNATPRFYQDSVTGTATKSRCILSNELPCLCSFQARPEADQLVNRSRFYWIFPYNVRKPKMHLCMSTKLKYTYLNGQCRYACSKLPSRGLCDKVGLESHIMNASPCFYRHSVTGTATKSRCILSNDLLCLHSFKDRPEADHESFKVLLNISAPHEEAEESLHEY